MARFGVSRSTVLRRPGPNSRTRGLVAGRRGNRHRSSPPGGRQSGIPRGLRQRRGALRLCRPAADPGRHRRHGGGRRPPCRPDAQSARKALSAHLRHPADARRAGAAAGRPWRSFVDGRYAGIAEDIPDPLPVRSRSRSSAVSGWKFAYYRSGDRGDDPVAGGRGRPPRTANPAPSALRLSRHSLRGGRRAPIDIRPSLYPADRFSYQDAVLQDRGAGQGSRGPSVAVEVPRRSPAGSGPATDQPGGFVEAGSACRPLSERPGHARRDAPPCGGSARRSRCRRLPDGRVEAGRGDLAMTSRTFLAAGDVVAARTGLFRPSRRAAIPPA